MTEADMIEAMAQTYAAAWRADISEYQGVEVATWDAMSKVQQQAMRRVSKAVALAVVQPELDRLRAENARLRSALLDAREFVEVEHERREDSCLDADHEYLSEVYDLAAKIDAVLFPRAALSPSPADGEGR